MLMVTKIGRLVTNHERLLPITSHDTLIMWFFKITWETRTFISLLSQCLWPPNLAGLWLTISGSRSKILLFFWSRGLTRSREKLKAVYPHYHSVYSSRNWGVGDLLSIWPMIDTIKNWKHISTTTIPMATKLGRVVLYHKKLLIIKLHDPSITWFCKVTRQIKFLCLHLQ